MIRCFIIIFLTLIFCATMLGQNTITGVVIDSDGKPLSGAAVNIVNQTAERSITDKGGVFLLNANFGEFIEISYADAIIKRTLVDTTNMLIQIRDGDYLINNLNQTTTSRRSTISSSSIGAKEFLRNSMPDTYDVLYGQLSGLTLIQSTEYNSSPGRKAIRGRGGVLYIVDGFPRAIENVNPADVESVTVLKDGAATALYGTRGANGVVVITTKRGIYKTTEVDVKYTYGLGLPINVPVMADAATYAKAVNEALYYDGLATDMFGRFTQDQIEYFGSGSGDPDLYPSTDWLGAATRDYSNNNQFEICFRGGGENIRYYSSIVYQNDFGVLNEDYVNYSEKYTSQIFNYRLGMRLNLDADLTSTTHLKTNMFAKIQETNRPNSEISTIFNNFYKTPSAAFPIYTQNGRWGSTDLLKMNPIAEIADNGFYKNNGRLLQFDTRIVQDLNVIIPGLKAEAAVAFDNNAVYKEVGKKPYLYEINILADGSKVTSLGGQDDALVINNEGLENQYMKVGAEAQLSYGRLLGLNHNVNGLLLYRQDSHILPEQSESMHRNNLMFQFAYDFKERYLLDVMVNQAGTSVLAKGDKYRTYPAISAGWIASNEEFMKNLKAIDFLKVRGSFGRSGYDAIDYYLDKQFWGSGNSYYFGKNNSTFGGSSEKNLAMESFTIERSDKYNFGIDANLFGGLSASFDAFVDQRRDMLVNGNNVVSSVIGIDVAKQNAGSIDYKGFEFSAMWNGSVKNFKYYLGGNMTLLNSEVIENGEGFKPYSYMSAKGYPEGQAFGLEAIGYFNDQFDIDNSPVHAFSVVRPGDIKYKDQNKDNVIDQYDVLAIGHSTSQPGLYYGISLGFEYRGFGMDAVFQGVGKYSQFLNTDDIYWPLRNNSNISTWYLNEKTRWTEDNKMSANLPRLTTLDNANNFRKSTQWLVDGSFLKLRNLKVYYNLPQGILRSLKIDQLQIFLSGNNLLSIDNVSYLNCEDLEKNYFDILSVFAGVKVNF